MEFAAGKGPKYYGASAKLDVFQLSGVSNKQQSESQIVLSKGAGGPKNYINTVQAGWLVSSGFCFCFCFFLFFVSLEFECSSSLILAACIIGSPGESSTGGGQPRSFLHVLDCKLSGVVNCFFLSFSFFFALLLF